MTLLNLSGTMTSREIFRINHRRATSCRRLWPMSVRTLDTMNQPPVLTADEPTAVLIARIQAGDAGARERLIGKYLPILRRWAHGRMPARARDISDTDDIVQIAIMRAVARIGDIRADGSGAFLAYLRSVLINHIRDELRRSHRRPEGVEIDETLVDDNHPSLLEEMIGLDRLRAYENALTKLTRRQQEAVVLRIEFGLEYDEIAAEVGGTPDGARMLLARALTTIAREMDDED